MLQHPSSVFAASKAGPKHHYIPVFYLKAWTGADGRLCEFSRPFKEVKALRKSPSATGFVRGLYNIPGLAPDKTGALETNFLSLADDWAARAHRILLTSDRKVDFPDLRTRAGWARFIYSLVLRTPEYLERGQIKMRESAIETVESVRADYQNLRRPTDPETFDEFKERFLANPTNTSIRRFLHRLIDSKRVLLTICNMRWFTVDFDRPSYFLLTSDRPVIMTNGLLKEDLHIVVPVSPSRLFLAVNSERTADKIHAMKPQEMIRRANHRVSECSVRYVYGTDDAQHLFVSRRLGKAVRSSPLG